MVFSSNLKGYKQDDEIGIQILSSRGIMQADEEELNYEPAKILKRSSEEIHFEIDHSLPLGSNIAIKITKESPNLKAMDGVYEIQRGRVRSCVEVESEYGSHYEVCVQIFETVLQTEIVTSRLSSN